MRFLLSAIFHRLALVIERRSPNETSENDRPVVCNIFKKQFLFLF